MISQTWNAKGFILKVHTIPSFHMFELCIMCTIHIFYFFKNMHKF